MRILIVEDSSVTGEALCEQLKDRGHDAQWAANGEAGLTKLCLHPCQVLVVDVYFPGMSGLEFLRRARLLPQAADSVAVVITAAGDEDASRIRQEVAAIPRSVLLRKPFATEELLETIAGMALVFGVEGR